jgi:hypothetical protein
VKVTVAPDIALDSPMEALFYGLCCFHEISVRQVDPVHGVAVDGNWYWPRFHVAAPQVLDVCVEVASGEDEAVLRPMRAAWRNFSARRLVVLYREELDSLRDAARPAQFAARLRLLAR